MFLLSWLVQAVETREGSNNTWNEVAVVAAGRLIIVQHRLQLTGSSVLCLQEVMTGSQTSCTQQVCLTHLQLGQSPSMCLRVCVCGITGQGQPIPLQTITSHRAKYIPTLPPQSQNLQFGRWSHVGPADRGERGDDGGGWLRARRRPPSPDEGGQPVSH